MKVKKFLKLMLISLLLTGCNLLFPFEEPPIIFERLTYDENNHWYESLLGQIDQESLEAHSYQIETVKEATCTEAGKERYTCDFCGYSFEKEISKTNHNYQLKHNDTNHWYECSCGDIKDNQEHSYQITHVSLPSHTIKGIDRYTCTVCNSTKDVEVSQLVEHVFNQEIVNEKFLASSATCTNKAKYYKSCVCGEIGTETFEYGEALGHDYGEWQIITEATQTSDGLKERECSRCHNKEQQSYSLNPTYNPANYYDGYYSSLTSWDNSSDLINKLHAIISGGTYRPLSYASKTTNWETNGYADQDLYDHEYLDVIYSDNKVLKTRTNVDWQREHAFCASLMTGTVTGDAVNFLGRATDFHNLFAAYSKANMSRGNKNYGNASSSRSGYKVTEYGTKYDDLNFEPADNDKGQVARAIFYMAVMYNQDVLDTANNVNMKALRVVDEYVSYDSKTYDAFAHGNKQDLLGWCDYAVSLQEYQHNQSVYSHVSSIDGYAQGNRNPFVDYPELIDYCFGDKINVAGKLEDLKPTYVELNMDKDEIHHYAIKDAVRTYDVGATFKKSDINVVAVKNNLTETSYTDFTLQGVSDNQVLSTPFTASIITPKNSISYDVNVYTDPITSSKYHYTTDASNFKAFKDQNGIEHTIALGDITWGVKWNNKLGASSGTIQNNKLGTQFGSASYPAGTITFTTKSSINNVNRIVFEGAPASSQSYDVTFKIDGTTVYTTKLTYIDSSTPKQIVYNLPTAKSGVVTIEISNINKACYCNAIAINY